MDILEDIIQVKAKFPTITRDEQIQLIRIHLGDEAHKSQEKVSSHQTRSTYYLRQVQTPNISG